MTKPDKDQRRNSYDDDDVQQCLDEIEGLEAQKRTIRAEAAGKCSALSKKIEDVKKTAVKLNIPKKILTTLLKQRKLEAQLQDLADDVPEDLIELYQEASGQFSWLKPEEEAVTPAQVAAGAAARRAREKHDEEQAEGERVLDEMVTH